MYAGGSVAFQSWPPNEELFAKGFLAFSAGPWMSTLSILSTFY
jgi:hypothetical protein